MSPSMRVIISHAAWFCLLASPRVALASRLTGKASDVKQLTTLIRDGVPKFEDDDCKSPKNTGCNDLAGKCCPAAGGMMLACCHQDKPNPPHPVGPHHGGPVKLTFYAYRAVKGAFDGTAVVRYTKGLYGISANLANAAGVLRYVHNEVVGRDVAAGARPPVCERKNGIDRIIRLAVTMHTTQEIYDKAHGQFMPFAAIDGQKFTVPGYEKLLDEYGNAVGCQSQSDGSYPGGVWYSFPGKGSCMFPNGGKHCTYNYALAGSVTLDELTGIDKLGGYKKFCNDGGVEFNGPRSSDDNVTVDFWKDYHNVSRNINRTKSLEDKFTTGTFWNPDHKEPPCDAWR